MTLLMNQAKEVLLGQGSSPAELAKLKEVENLVNIISAQAISGVSTMDTEQSKYFYSNLIPELILKAVTIQAGSADAKVTATEQLI